MNAIDNLMEYRNNKEKYLPLIDHETKPFAYRDKFDDVNIGWDCGFIGNRPYFLECWATTGITMLTIFLSTTGIEDYSITDLEKLLIEEAKIYTKKEGYTSPDFVPKYVDGSGNEFFSVNIVVGTEDEPTRIEGGGHLVPFPVLNELNGYPEDYEESEDDDSLSVKYEQVGFRGVYHEFLMFCLDDGEMRKVLSDFPGIDEANSYIGYGYIDHDAGVTVEILALVNAGNEIEFFESYSKQASTKIRMEELKDFAFVILPDPDDQIRSKYKEILDIIDEGYKCSEELHKTRCFDFLDRLRDPICIDDVKVILAKDGLDPEKVWVRIEGTRYTDNGAFLVGNLIVEPYQNFGVHDGDEILFNMQKIEGKGYCICDLE